MTGETMEYYKTDPQIIKQTLRKKRKVTVSDVERIVQKAFDLEKISLEEASTLIHCINDNASYDCVIQSANKLRRKIFGNYVKIYVPVYITNVCANNCVYCSFRRDNNFLKRNTLQTQEFLKEMEFLLEIGHRNIEVVLGYHQTLTKGTLLAEYIRPLKRKLDDLGGGTIILMSEPMDVKDYKVLREAGLTEVYTWQETYNIDQYHRVHPENTHKSLYEWRLQVFDRAIETGIERIGMGVLFGLYKWKYDELSLIRHGLWIRENYGIEPYAFGVPRLKSAHGALIQHPFYRVSNKMYKLSVAIRRLIFPFTHTYMNTRENLGFIIDLLNSGGTEINTEASTIPGGYTKLFLNNGEQFFHYSYDSKKVFRILEKAGFVPTFKEVIPIVSLKQKLPEEVT
ncbi:MAG: radical SAM protein [bacterium]